MLSKQNIRTHMRLSFICFMWRRTIHLLDHNTLACCQSFMRDKQQIWKSFFALLYGEVRVFVVIVIVDIFFMYIHKMNYLHCIYTSNTCTQHGFNSQVCYEDKKNIHKSLFGVNFPLKFVSSNGKTFPICFAFNLPENWIIHARRIFVEKFQWLPQLQPWSQLWNSLWWINDHFIMLFF